MHDVLVKLTQLCLTMEEQLHGEWHVWIEIEHKIQDTNLVKVPVTPAIVLKAANKKHKVMVGFPIPLSNLNVDCWNRLTVYGMAFIDKIRKKDL